MMKKIFLKTLQAGCLWLLLGQLSCSGVNSDLQISLSSKTFVLLDADAESCYSLITAADTKDISAIHFSLPSIAFTWRRAEALTIHWISFKLSGGALSTAFTKVVGADQLLYSFYGSSITTETAVTISTAGTASSQCPFKVGSVPITKKENDSYGSVIVTVYGQYQSGGNSVPVTAKAYGDYYFKGTN